MSYCPRCSLQIRGATYDGLCYDCYKEMQTKPKSDDDLRDEVAKAVSESMLSFNNYDLNDSAKWSFDYADAWMAERARRREGR